MIDSRLPDAASAVVSTVVVVVHGSVTRPAASAQRCVFAALAERASTY
jgi:hypothetical protein